MKWVLFKKVEKYKRPYVYVRMLPDLCKLLENVCTARDFLLEVGGPGDKSLAGFMVNYYYYYHDTSTLL